MRLAWSRSILSLVLGQGLGLVFISACRWFCVFQRKPKVPPGAGPLGCVSTPKESPAGLGTMLSTGEHRPCSHGNPMVTLSPW